MIDSSMILRRFAPMVAVSAMVALSACGEKEADAKADAGASSEIAASERSEAPSVTDEETAVALAEDEAEREAAEAKAEADAAPVLTFRAGDSTLTLTGADVAMITPAHDPDADIWAVFLQMESDAATAFYEMTSTLEGSALDVIVDEAVVSTPKIDTPIYGGGFAFNVDDRDAANELVSALTGSDPAGEIIPASEFAEIEDTTQEPDEESAAAAEDEGTDAARTE